MEILEQTQTLNTCPNKFPTMQSEVPYRIAVIGEAPGADEVVRKEPFVGTSGRLLDYLLNRAGILRGACFLGNVCQHRPPGNELKVWNWNDGRITDGLAQLKQDVDIFKPNLILCLGGVSFAASKCLTPNIYLPTKRKNPDASITLWRGSLFAADLNSPFVGRKTLGTFHPASALRVYEQTPLILFDLKRAKLEGQESALVLPRRRTIIATTVEEVERYLGAIQTKTSVDIEGYVNNLSCISFSPTPFESLIVPFTGYFPNYWSEGDELRVWLAIKRFLESRVPKVLQNGLYDRFVLAYTYGIMCNNTSDDTLVKHWELFCEVKKSLAVQASLYTKEPYWKSDREEALEGK